MNEKPSLISIIVPVYNVERYLAACIDSVLRQTYKNFELILVDDGSTDHSGEICDRLAKTDSRMRVFHKKNGGLSDARNFGMKYAQGDYITFIDSDDAVSPRFIEILLLESLKNSADIVQCQFALREELLETGSGKSAVYRGADGFRQFLMIGEVYVSSWCKLYRRELFDDISFPYGRINEDVCTTYKLLYRSAKTVCIDRALYWHRMREGSITHTAFSDRNLEVLNVRKEIEDFLESCRGDYQDEIDYFEYRITLGVYNFLLSSENYGQYMPQGKALRQKIIDFDVKNPCVSMQDRCVNLFIMISPVIYRVFIKEHKKRKSQGIKIT